MRILFHDFETFSEINLLETGLYKYASHSSTEIICLSWAYTTGKSFLWSPRDSELPAFFKEIKNIHFHAWNAEFEFAIWNLVGVRKYGFPSTNISQYFCTMALASFHGYPLSLDKAGTSINVQTKKDKRGSYLINKLSKPRKPSKNNPATRWTYETATEDYEDMYKYCQQDVQAERAIFNVLPFQELPINEQEVWIENAKLNQKGIPIDIKSVNLIINTLEKFEIKLTQELQELTDYKISTIGQTTAIVNWINSKIDFPKIPNLQIDTVLTWLDEYLLPSEVRRILELRKLLAKTSVKKFYKMKKAVNSDNRIRDNLFYYGGHTGRFSGKNLQIQNLPTINFDDADFILDIMKIHGLSGLALLYPDIMSLGSSLVRPMICATNDYILRIGDFKSIENVGVCWLAGDIRALDLFNQKLDQYIDMATAVYNIPYEKVTKEQRGIGKQVVLGCGYGLGAAGFQRTAAQFGVNIDFSFSQKLVNLYRQKYSLVKRLWYNLYDAAKECITQGYQTKYLKIRFQKIGNYLLMYLPSGRPIIYPEICIKPQQAPWNPAQEIQSIWYSYYNHTAGGWVSEPMSPGHMTENAVQGLCRDILVDAQLRLLKAGYSVIFHVHDEIITEDLKTFGSLEEYNNLIEQTNEEIYPNFPVVIESFEAKRYRKE